MENRLIITKKDNMIISAFFEGKDMISVSLNSSEADNILGNIYLGKVKNIVKNINAAFIEIADGQMCYYSLTENRMPIPSTAPAADYNTKKAFPGLKIGDELIIQVTKEDGKMKAPVVSSKLNFTGKYVVLTYGKPTIGVSSKITDEQERKRLKEIAKSYLHTEYGFVIRTNAMNISKIKIITELKQLIHTYETICKYGVHQNCFSLLFSTPPAYLCDIRDSYTQQVDEFITDDELLYENVRQYLEQYQPEDLEKLRLYRDSSLSLSQLYNLQHKLDEAMRSLVWLKSGASLVISPTEALTVIDVNTGKAVAGKRQVQDTFLKVNLEAAKEIARQIRLRNLSGIIIIDFIDLALTKDKELLMEELKQHFSKDPVKTTLVDMTALGLVEITRKKVHKPLHEQMEAVNRNRK